MGFLGSIGRFVSRPGPAIKRVAIAYSTMGVSELVRAVAPSAAPTFDAAVVSTAGSIAAPYTGGASLLAASYVNSTAGQRTVNPQPTSDFNSAPVATQGVNPMAIDIRQVLGTVGTIFGGNQNPYFQGISGVANIASQFVQPVSQRMPPVGAGVPMVRPNPYGAVRALGGAGRGFFLKYPNLAAGMNALKFSGRNIKRSQLYSMLKRFGPDMLVTGGILSAAAIAELMQAGPGHRRMNAGNAKALRRSLRRLDAFHHLCVRADKYRKGSGRRSKPCKTGSATQFVRQG